MSRRKAQSLPRPLSSGSFPALGRLDIRGRTPTPETRVSTIFDIQRFINGEEPRSTPSVSGGSDARKANADTQLSRKSSHIRSNCENVTSALQYRVNRLAGACVRFLVTNTLKIRTMGTQAGAELTEDSHMTSQVRGCGFTEGDLSTITIYDPVGAAWGEENEGLNGAILASRRYATKLLAAKDRHERATNLQPLCAWLTDFAQRPGAVEVKEWVINRANELIEFEDGVHSQDARNLFLCGPSGVGKTETAVLLSEFMKLIGWCIDANPHTQGTDRFIGRYEGQTDKKITLAIQEDFGTAVVVDEAYRLVPTSETGGYAKEAVDTLVDTLDKNKGFVAYLFLGYPQDIDELKQTNSGFPRRFNATLTMWKYTPDELFQIWKKQLELRKFGTVDSDVEDVVKRSMQEFYAFSVESIEEQETYEEEMKAPALESDTGPRNRFQGIFSSPSSTYTYKALDYVYHLNADSVRKLVEIMETVQRDNRIKQRDQIDSSRRSSARNPVPRIPYFGRQDAVQSILQLAMQSECLRLKKSANYVTQGYLAYDEFHNALRRLACQ